MRVSISPNPNCEPVEDREFKELGVSRPICGILSEDRGREVRLDVIGVDGDDSWVKAQAVKVADSGDGYAFLITGGRWGLRLRPAGQAGPWSLDDLKQWGEPFKLYGSEGDIVYE